MRNYVLRIGARYCAKAVCAAWDVDYVGCERNLTRPQVRRSSGAELLNNVEQGAAAPHRCRFAGDREITRLGANPAPKFKV